MFEERLERNKILYDILYVIFKRKFFLIAFCFISFVLIIFFTFLKGPVFNATSKILVRTNPQQQLILFRGLSASGEEFTKVNPVLNLIQILTSQEMAREVVEKFDLDKRLRKKKEEPEALRDIIKQFLFKVITCPISIAQNIGLLEKEKKNYFADATEAFIEDAQDIELEEDTNVINLTIMEESPKISMDIANYMTESLAKRSGEIEKSSAQNAYDFTRDQAGIAGRALKQVEDGLLDFMKKENIISLEEEKESKLEELQKIEGQYIDVKVELSEENAKLIKMRAEISRHKENILDSAIAANNPVITTLKNSLQNLEIQLSGDLVKFTDSSKSIKSLKAQALEAREKIENELKMITENDIALLYTIHPDLPKEYFQLITHVAALDVRKKTLEKEINKIKAETFSLSLKEIELKRINRNIEISEKLYTKLLDKHSELAVQKTSEITGYDLKIIDKAFLPDDAEPDSPKWIILIPLGFIGCMLLSFMTVFFIEYWDESFKSPDEIEERLGMPVLCTLPDIKN